MNQSLINSADYWDVAVSHAEAEAHNCFHCLRRHLCLANEMDIAELLQFSQRVTRPRPVRGGQHVVTSGEDFRGIYIVRSGYFKSYAININGQLQVTGFHLPGEMFGLDGAGGDRYRYCVQALDTGSICCIPFVLSESIANNSGNSSANEDCRLMRLLLRMMTSVMNRDRDMILALVRMNAKQRLAAFLVDLFIRMRRAGLRDDEFRLCMRRTEIGNYLGLAEETVSRLFTRLQQQGILNINRRWIENYDLRKLRLIAAGKTADRSGSQLVD